MCGLAGYARRKSGDNSELAVEIGVALLQAMEKRGAHATGFAAFGAESFICKSAIPAREAIRSEPWRKALDRLNGDTTIFMGHTRHSTHPTNTRLDEAAHPFHIGKVVGAHNGIIANWRDIYNEFADKSKGPWIVDSQAAVGILAAIKEPEKALELLDGYWALTWVRNDQLFMCRTNEAPLSFAYVASMQTMFWCSEYGPLRNILGDAKLDCVVWDLGPNSIYRFDVEKFDNTGVHAQTRAVAFKGRRSRPTQTQLSLTSGGKKSKPSFDELVKMVVYQSKLIKDLQDEVASIQQELDVINQIAGFPDDDQQLTLP